MSTCFVIQPFDQGPFDRRYIETIEPAIRAAHLEPYRVDWDPSVTIPIDDIERKIRDATICVADISVDNPNVWYEVGYAHASNKEVVLVCAGRPKFPFDIQHRKIITYKTESASDFERLRKEITEQLIARVDKIEKLRGIESLSTGEEVAGLTSHEIAALSILMAARAYEETTASHRLVQEMENLGHNGLATRISVRCLLKKKMILETVDSDMNGNKDVVYSISDVGEDWLIANQSQVNLKAAPPRKNSDHGGRGGRGG